MRRETSWALLRSGAHSRACRGGEAGEDDRTPAISTLTQLGGRLKHFKDEDITQKQLTVKA